jgi:hypothetical protein
VSEPAPRVSNERAASSELGEPSMPSVRERGVVTP